MIINPRTCWQYCIQTDNLREPAESWELLQYRILHPDKTIEECCADKNIDYGKARKWSFKYYHASRIQAYTRDMGDALNTAVTKLKLENIKEETKKNPAQNAVLNNELYFLQDEQKQMVELKRAGQPIPEYLEERVAKKEREYYINRNNKLKGDAQVYNIASEPVDIENVESLIEDAPGVKQFMDAMKANREANHE